MNLASNVASINNYSVLVIWDYLNSFSSYESSGESYIIKDGYTLDFWPNGLIAYTGAVVKNIFFIFFQIISNIKILLFANTFSILFCLTMIGSILSYIISVAVISTLKYSDCY